MKCPRCVQRVHRMARQCPHCGFGIGDVDKVFGDEDVRVGTLTDAAGVLRKGERVATRRMLRRFQNRFPQLFFGIYFGTFKELPGLRQFGFWLLNRAVVLVLHGNSRFEHFAFGLLVLLQNRLLIIIVWHVLIRV